MLPGAVLTHLKAGARTALRPEPVRIGWWVQPAAVTPRKHDRPSLTTLLEFVLDCPRRALGDAETTAELQAGDALLALGQVIEGAKPAPQRKLGCCEDRAGGQRRLPPARGALIKRGVLTRLCRRPPHSGQTKPSGHRHLTTAARHCSSLPYRRSNSASLSPFWC